MTMRSSALAAAASRPTPGVATQLATLLGRPLDVRSMPQPGEPYEDKKLVIILLPMAELVP